MASYLLSRQDLNSLLHEWLDVWALVDREAVDSVLDLAEQVLRRYSASHSRRNDVEELQFVDGEVVIHHEVARLSRPSSTLDSGA